MSPRLDGSSLVRSLPHAPRGAGRLVTDSLESFAQGSEHRLQGGRSHTSLGTPGCCLGLLCYCPLPLEWLRCELGMVFKAPY